MESTKKESWIVKVGRKLPESNILFLYMTLGIIVISALLQGNYDGVVEGSSYTVRNMLSFDGIRWFFYNFIPNFVAYPPLGIVTVGVIGFGFAEKTGLLGALIKKMSIITPEKFILPVIIFIGINSSVASDAGYIVLIPLAGALYAGLGKNPLIGITASFAAVSAGFGAAIVPTPSDNLLGAVTERITLENGYTLNGLTSTTMNYVFMFASVIFLTVVITFIARKFVIKNVDMYKYTIPEDIKNSDITKMTPEENKALKSAGIGFLVVLGIIVILAIGPLANIENTVDYKHALATLDASKLWKPILDNIIAVMIFIFLVPSICYGKSIGKITSQKSYIALTVDAMKDMAYFLVFAIFAGNFLATFSVSGLDKYIANNGANLLISANIQSPILLMVGFILISAFINLFMGSASAKWNLLAPVFIPMLLIASDGGLTAEIIQAGYRVADSSTNVITPLMTYAGVILLACRRYVDDFEFGDLMALMIPYSIGILVSWTAFFILWMALGIPFGI